MDEKKRANCDIPPSLRISTLEAAIEDEVSLETRCTCSEQLCLLKTNNGEINYELSTVITSLRCVLNGPSSRFPRYDYTCTILVAFAVHSLVTSKRKRQSLQCHIETPRQGPGTATITTTTDTRHPPPDQHLTLALASLQREACTSMSKFTMLNSSGEASIIFCKCRNESSRGKRDTSS